MRREGLLAWDFIADGTRWQRKPDSFTNAPNYIEAVARSYRRDLWQRQGLRVEFWLEKDALADVVAGVTYKWDASLMVSRAQSSATFLYSAKQAAFAARVPTYVYLLYDADGGGNRAARTIERELSFSPPAGAGGVDIPPVYVERLAVTGEQIEDWNLPTRPAKRTDPEAAKNPDYAVELDAIDPERLTQLVDETIRRHVDMHAWGVEQKIEAEEREGLKRLAAAWEERPSLPALEPKQAPGRRGNVPGPTPGGIPDADPR